MVAQGHMIDTRRSEDNVTLFNFSSTRPCVHCPDNVLWMHTRAGTRLPFDAELIPIGASAGAGWLPGTWTTNGRRRICVAPITHYSHDKQQRAQWVLIKHQCAGYLTARKQRTAVG